MTSIKTKSLTSSSLKKGWYRESYRHSLAARGIRTSMLFKKDDTKKVFDVFKSPAEKYDQGHEISRGFANKIKDRLMQVMDDLEKKGYMNMEDNRRFMEDQYAPLEDQFVKRYINANQFKDEVDRAYRLFYQHNKKKNAVFGFGQDDSDKEPTIFGPEEKRGTSIWGF